MKTHTENNSVHSKVKRAKRAVREVVDEAEETAGNLYERARDGVQSIGEESVHFVRENPFKTALAALAIGFAMGFVARR